MKQNVLVIKLGCTQVISHFILNQNVILLSKYLFRAFLSFIETTAVDFFFFFGMLYHPFSSKAMFTFNIRIHRFMCLSSLTTNNDATSSVLESGYLFYYFVSFSIVLPKLFTHCKIISFKLKMYKECKMSITCYLKELVKFVW